MQSEIPQKIVKRKLKTIKFTEMKQFLLGCAELKETLRIFLRVEAFRLMETLNENFHFSLPMLSEKYKKSWKSHSA